MSLREYNKMYLASSTRLMTHSNSRLSIQPHFRHAVVLLPFKLTARTPSKHARSPIGAVPRLSSLVDSVRACSAVVWLYVAKAEIGLNICRLRNSRPTWLVRTLDYLSPVSIVALGWIRKRGGKDTIRTFAEARQRAK